jgi:hypothetical protein
VSFLRKYNLLADYKLNIECNHATLSGACVFAVVWCGHRPVRSSVQWLLGCPPYPKNLP